MIFHNPKFADQIIMPDISQGSCAQLAGDHFHLGGGHQSQKKYTSSANIFGDIIKPHSHNRLCLFHTSHKRDEYKEMANVNIRVKTHTYSFLLFSDDI